MAQKLTSFPRKESISQSQQMYNEEIVEAGIQDSKIPGIGAELSTMSVNKLNYVITHINKLIADKFETITTSKETSDLDHIKGYVQGLKDIKRLFDSALAQKQN